MKHNTKDTMCWHCANAVPGPDRGCDWPRLGIQIGTVDEAGVVVECQEFEPDRPMIYVDDDGVRKLAEAVLRSAAVHYHDCCEDEEAALAEWIESARALARFYGGEYRFDRIWLGEDTACWVRWMRSSRNDVAGLSKDEHFFTSEAALMYADADPVDVMNGIRRIVGVPPIRKRRGDAV